MAYVRLSLLDCKYSYTFSACYLENHEDQGEKLGELLNVSSLRYLDGRHWCAPRHHGNINSVINRLPTLRKLDLEEMPSGIRDGQLRHLETLRVSSVKDWSWLVKETTASLRCLHFTVGVSCYKVGHGSSFSGQY